ncbi:TetR/AcrR family transcriptional regulator [Pseudomonas defluvii]|nr:TetR/AcrR family transcriptional regulator [Pseudomonas defluvii]
MAPTSKPEQLPALRKRPTQSRSRALVDAVEQACLQILDEAGEAALTVARIAEISGVAVGSIYQYFPNKDAIVALLYERVLDEESEALLRLRERLV